MRLARRAGMRIMGPNCNGMISFVDGFAMTTSATIAGPRRAAGNVGVVSQSGGAGQFGELVGGQPLRTGIELAQILGHCIEPHTVTPSMGLATAIMPFGPRTMKKPFPWMARSDGVLVP